MSRSRPRETASSRSARWCHWAKRASAASASTNGSADRRQQPDPASEVHPGAHPLARADTGPRTKEATMTTTLVALVLLCLMSVTAMAQEPKVTSLMSKDLTENSGREVLMITVEHRAKRVERDPPTQCTCICLHT